jgi:hypothetical protein
MAIVFDGPVLPDDLTVFVREVPLPNALTLNQLLPDKYIQSNRLDFANITKTGRTARFRMFDGPLHVAQRDTASTSVVKLPPLSDSLGMGELERLQLEFARTGGTNQGAFVNAIYNDAQTLTENVQRRMELARGDVLTDGKFTMMSSEGLLESDFSLPAGNIVTAPTLWSDTVNSDPITDITTWVQAYATTLGNGYRPAKMTTSLTVLNFLLTNAKIRNLYSSLVGAPSRLSPVQLNSALADYGLPEIATPYDSQVDVDGVSTRVTPVNKVYFTPPDPATNLGGTYWGVSATALELVNAAETDLSFEDAPGIVGVVIKDGPPFRQYSFVDAVGLPALENPRALLVATVS